MEKNSNSYILFLDDVRNPNSFLNDIRTWIVVRNYAEFVNTISERGLPKFVSFDHDLAFEHYPLSEGREALTMPVEIPYDKYKYKTGYDCARWIIEYCEKRKVNLPDYQVHSMNPVGKQNILRTLENFTKRKNVEQTYIDNNGGSTSER